MSNLLEAIDKSDWQTFRFDEIAHNISKRVEPGATDLTVYVGLEHLDSGSLHIKRTGSPADVDGTKLLVYAGDIIFGRRRAYQRKAAIATFDGICSAHALVLRANPEVIEPRLFPFFLHSDAFMHRAVDISVGGLSPTINWGNLKVEEFQIPPLDQQTRLADLLWAADAVSENYVALVEQLENLTNVLVEKEFYRDDVPRGKLSTVVTGITGGSSLNGANVSQIASHEKAVLKVSAVGRKGFVPSESKVLTNQSEFISRFSVKQDDLLITRANTKELVGRVCLVEADYPNLMLCDKTLRIDTDEAIASKDYLVEVLRSSTTRHQIEGLATGTSDGMKNISQKGILSIELPLPSHSEQMIQAARLRKIKAEEREATHLLAVHNSAKQHLINQIFSE